MADKKRTRKDLIKDGDLVQHNLIFTKEESVTIRKAFFISDEKLYGVFQRSLMVTACKAIVQSDGL